MSYDDFWNGDNEMPRMYRKAYEIKQKQDDQQAWLQGAYIYNAIGALAPALKAFAKGRPKAYLERPFLYDETEGDSFKPDKKTKEAKSDEKAKSWLEMWAISFNERFEQKEKLKQEGGDANG